MMAELGNDPNMPPQVAQIFNMTMAITSAAAYASFLYLVWPAALLIILFHPQVRAAFQAKPRAPRSDEEDDFDEPLDEETDTPREDHIQPEDDRGIRE